MHRPLLASQVVTLDMGLLVAGTKYRGEFEERLKKLMDEIKQSDDIILVRGWGGWHEGLWLEGRGHGLAAPAVVQRQLWHGACTRVMGGAGATHTLKPSRARQLVRVNAHPCPPPAPRR